MHGVCLITLFQMKRGTVPLVMSVLLMGKTNMKDEWRCVYMDAGEQSAMISGTPMMLQSSVDNWDILRMVRI